MTGYVAVNWQTTVTTGSLIVSILLGLLALGGIIYAVVRKGQLDDLKHALEIADHNAESWEGNFEAERVKTERLTMEFADEKVRAARELASTLEKQREIRHEIKAERDLARLEVSALHKIHDTTEVLQGVQQILRTLTETRDISTSTLADMLEHADERAATRDKLMLETQAAIAESIERTNVLLERIADRVVERVGEVVAERVEQLQPDTGGSK